MCIVWLICIINGLPFEYLFNLFDYLILKHIHLLFLQRYKHTFPYLDIYVVLVSSLDYCTEHTSLWYETRLILVKRDRTINVFALTKPSFERFFIVFFIVQILIWHIFTQTIAMVSAYNSFTDPQIY